MTRHALILAASVGAAATLAAVAATGWLWMRVQAKQERGQALWLDDDTEVRP